MPQIHELNEKEITSPAYVAVDDGEDTYRLDLNDVIGGSGDGLTEEIKQALLQIAEKVAYIDEDGQDYYDDLYNALYAVTAVSLNVYSATINTIGGTVQLSASTVPAGASVTWTSSNTSIATVSENGLVTSVAYGNCTITATAGSVSASCSLVVSQATLTSIAAVYTQSGTVYDTDSLDSLKTDLVVTAVWSDSTQTTVPSTDYTLSGTLAVGTSTVTVSYGGKTTTFNVTVTAAPTLVSIAAVYTQSGTVYDTDSLDSLKADLVVTATYSDSSTETVPSADYTLSGTLTVGTSTITVTFSGVTTTFTVTVTASAVLIYSEPITMAPNGAQASWSNSEAKFSQPSGSAGWPSVNLNGLQYKFSEVSNKTLRIECDLTIQNLSGGPSGNGAMIIPGLYKKQNPLNMGSDRAANYTLYTKIENGTFHVTVEEAISTMFTASGLDDYYLGVSFSMNWAGAYDVVFSNIVAEVY